MTTRTLKESIGPTQTFTGKDLLSIIGGRTKVLSLKKNQILFSQWDASDAVFYILEGKIKLTVVSKKNKEAVIAVLGHGAFLGEGCLTPQLTRMKTATSMGASRIVRIEKADMVRALHDEPAFSEPFMAYLLSRNIRIEEDLVDQLFNSSEKRLARALLLLAHYGNGNRSELLIPKVSESVLADMIGISQPKVSFFMNKFRRLGFIDNNGGLHVHSSLLNMVLQD
jgi:CRP/FNR family transcriptional regulator, cyclic AMP receptor protein